MKRKRKKSTKPKLNPVDRFDKKLHGYFIAFMRRAFRWSPQIKAALKAAEEKPGWFRCAGACKKLYQREGVQVDHVEPVVPVTGAWNKDWNEYRDRCVYGILQVLCKTDHQTKTWLEQQERVKYREYNKGKPSDK